MLNCRNQIGTGHQSDAEMQNSLSLQTVKQKIVNISWNPWGRRS